LPAFFGKSEDRYITTLLWCPAERLDFQNMKIIKPTFDYLKDVLFPVFCFGCGKEGIWVCEECYKTIDTKGIFGHHHIAITPYNEDWLIGKIVRNFKYDYVEELSLVIERLIRNFVSKNREMFANIDNVVPVPLHKKREAERGFNQSEIIADYVSRVINKPVIKCLTRHRNTEHQARLNREKRLVNVTDAFIFVDYGRKSVNNIHSRVLLVDDVYTTGATMRECEKALKNSGALDVRGFSLARG